MDRLFYFLNPMMKGIKYKLYVIIYKQPACIIYLPAKTIKLFLSYI